MGYTMIQKILADAANFESVAAGEILDVPVDLAYIHDNNGPIVIKEYAKVPNAKVWDPGKVALILDHHPSSTLRAVQHHYNLRQFAKNNKISNIFDVGRGVSHPVLAEEGLARPGRIIVGTDSHTVGLGAFGCFATGVGSTEMAGILITGRCWFQVPETMLINFSGSLSDRVGARDVGLFMLKHFGPSLLNYMAVELAGPLINEFSVFERMVLAVMSLEMGVKAALIKPDAKTLDFFRMLEINPQKIFEPDHDASYSAVVNLNVNLLEPMVATPGLPTNGVAVSEAAGIKVQQATLGSCSGAFLHDIAAAAEIVKGHKVHPQVRFIIVPNSSKVLEEASKNGLLQILLEAGAIIGPPACGTCGAYEIGFLAPSEVCISTTTRNMDGRMGPGGKIYLAGPSTVAASALMGRITDPRELD